MEDLSDLALVSQIRIKGSTHRMDWIEGLTITLEVGRAQGKIVITM